MGRWRGERFMPDGQPVEARCFVLICSSILRLQAPPLPMRYEHQKTIAHITATGTIHGRAISAAASFFFAV